MKILKWFFSACVLMALLVYSLIFLNISVPDWVRFYAADFLCMPIVLYICVFVIRKWKQAPKLQLSLLTIMSVTAFYALYFEVFLPPRSERYTADVWDVVMYFSGAWLFYVVQIVSTNASKTKGTPAHASNRR